MRAYAVTHPDKSQGFRPDGPAPARSPRQPGPDPPCRDHGGGATKLTDARLSPLSPGDDWARLVGESPDRAWLLLADLDFQLVCALAEPWRRFALRAAAWAWAMRGGTKYAEALLDHANAQTLFARHAADLTAQIAKTRPDPPLTEVTWAAWTACITDPAGAAAAADWAAKAAYKATPDKTTEPTSYTIGARVRVAARIDLLLATEAVVWAWERKHGRPD